MQDFHVLEKTSQVIKAQASPKKGAKTPGKKSQGKKSAASVKQEEVEATLPTKIVFIDSSSSEEQAKKESFENWEEANGVADYLEY